MINLIAKYDKIICFIWQLLLNCEIRQNDPELYPLTDRATLWTYDSASSPFRDLRPVESVVRENWLCNEGMPGMSDHWIIGVLGKEQDRKCPIFLFFHYSTTPSLHHSRTDFEE
jgi:hypothetical protein